MTKATWDAIYRYCATHRWTRSLLLANVTYFLLMFVYHLLRYLLHSYPVGAGWFWLGWLVVNLLVFLLNYLESFRLQKKNWE